VSPPPVAIPLVDKALLAVYNSHSEALADRLGLTVGPDGGNLSLGRIGGEMRDIRKDLKERLEAIADEKRAAQNRLANLDKAETMLQVLLEEEQLRWKSQQPRLVGLETVARPKTNGRTPLGRFIREIMSDGREWQTAELAKLAKNRGLIAEGKSPLRVLHFSLVGMKQNGLVEKVGLTSWRLPRHSENGGEASEE